MGSISNLTSTTADCTALLDLLLRVAVAARVLRAEVETHSTIPTMLFGSVAVGLAGRWSRR